MHSGKNKILSSIVLLFVGWDSLGQTIENNCFWIISYEREVSGKDVGIYYWVVNDVSKDCIMFPLSLPVDLIQTKGVFPGDCLSDCNGYPFVNQVQLTDKDSGTLELIQCVAKNKRLLQKIRKRWKDQTMGKGVEDLRRKPEVISIYATPVQGIFESGIRVLQIDQTSSDWRSIRPVSDIRACNLLWEKDAIIKYIDFSFVKFAAPISPEITSGDNIHYRIPKVVNPFARIEKVVASPVHKFDQLTNYFDNL